MGGEGSGRKPGTESVVKNLMGFNQPAPTDNAVLYLPNYSGIKDSVRKDYPSGWTTGSVVFIGATGDFTQDNANLFWDDTNKRLGIGTTSPTNKLTVAGTLDFDASTRTLQWPNTVGQSNSRSWGFIGEQGAYGRFELRSSDASDTTLDRTVMSFDLNGSVGIGTTGPTSTNGGLDIASGGLSLILGADGSASTRTNVTNKDARLGVYHYTNAEEPATVFLLGSKVATNLLDIGGGSGSMNAVTQIGFWTAANNTTLSGTERMRIDANGTQQITETTDNTPTIVLSGGIFVSGGGLWFKGYAGTYTNLAVS